MTSNTSAAVISLREAPKKAMSGAERSKAYRDRKRKAKGRGTEAAAPPQAELAPSTNRALGDEIPREELLKASSIAPAAPPVASAGRVTPPELPRATCPVTPARVVQTATASTITATAASRFQFAPILLNAAAFALAGVGVAINGWFARSLGSSDFAGWLFLTLGAAADLIALGMPSCAANLWQMGRRGTAALGWALWLVTFVFAVTAGLGFASTNVSDVTLARASRVTPAVTAAQTGLSDAIAARDRECKGGVGKFCREREAAVAERRQVLDTAQAAVGQRADPQTDAASKLVVWTSRGLLRPTPEDFEMLRLMLLALLPQIGGLLMMVARSRAGEI
ncbi:hypothetical protein [Bradyrhizobium sp. USDA 4486]